MPVPSRPFLYGRHPRHRMDFRAGLRLRILASLRKFLEIRRFLLRRLYRSLADFANHDLLWPYKAAASLVFPAQRVMCCSGIDPHVASGREQVSGKQLPLPPGNPEGVSWVVGDRGPGRDSAETTCGRISP